MLIKIIRNFLLMSLFLSGVNAIAEGEAVVITNEVQAEQRQVLVFEELRPDIFTENCIQYGSNTKSFWFSNVVFSPGENKPFSSKENCLLQAMDKGLKPICDEEKILSQQLEEGNYNDKDIAEIKETLADIKKIKDEYADDLYEVADDIDKMYKQTLAALNDSITDPLQKSLIKMLALEREVRGYRDIVTEKAQKLCGSSLRRNTDEG